MNIAIREDRRSLRDFFPAPALRHQVHYAFAHVFLPQYVHENPCRFFSYLWRADLPGGIHEPTRFIHSRWMMFAESAGLIPTVTDPDAMVFHRVTDFRMSLHELGGQPVALMQMPSPERGPEAFFVAAVLLAQVSDAAQWSPDATARVFTLEAKIEYPNPDPSSGLICEWTKDRTHRMRGGVTTTEEDGFLKALQPIM